MLRGLLFFLLSMPMFAGISWVQSASQVNGGGTNMAVPLEGFMTTGDSILVAVSGRSSTAGDTCTFSSVTDASNNTYSPVSSHSITDQVYTNNKYTVALYLANNITGGANSVTVNYNSSPTSGDCSVKVSVTEYSGVSKTSPVNAEQAVTGSSNATPDTMTGSLTLSSTNQMVQVVAVTTEGGTLTPSNGWTTVQNPVQGFLTMQEPVAGSGTIAPTIALSSELYFPNSYIMDSIGLNPASTSDYGVSPFSAVSLTQTGNSVFVPYTSGATTPNIQWTQTLTLGTAITKGNSLLVMAQVQGNAGSPTIVAISDSLGNYWSTVGMNWFGAGNTKATGLFFSSIKYAGTDTITLTFSGPNSNTSGSQASVTIGTGSIVGYEIHGFSPNPPENVQQATTTLNNGSTTMTTPSVQNYSPDDVVIAFGLDWSQNDTFTAATGITSLSTLQLANGTNYMSLFLGYKTTTSATSTPVTITSANAAALAAGASLNTSSFGVAFNALGTIASNTLQHFSRHAAFF